MSKTFIFDLEKKGGNSVTIGLETLTGKGFTVGLELVTRKKV